MVNVKEFLVADDWSQRARTDYLLCMRMCPQPHPSGAAAAIIYDSALLLRGTRLFALVVAVEGSIAVAVDVRSFATAGAGLCLAGIRGALVGTVEVEGIAVSRRWRIDCSPKPPLCSFSLTTQETKSAQRFLLCRDSLTRLRLNVSLKVGQRWR